MLQIPLGPKVMLKCHFVLAISFIQWYFSKYFPFQNTQNTLLCLWPYKSKVGSYQRFSKTHLQLLRPFYIFINTTNFALNNAFHKEDDLIIQIQTMKFPLKMAIYALLHLILFIKVNFTYIPIFFILLNLNLVSCNGTQSLFKCVLPANLYAFHFFLLSGC